jgi:hypothetical protein
MSVQIIQGGAVSFIIRIKDVSTGDPYDLTDVTEITTCFQNADGTELMLSLSGGISVEGDPLIGKIKVSLTSAQTALLALEELATLQLAITVNTDDPFFNRIPEAYSVLESVC